MARTLYWIGGSTVALSVLVLGFGMLAWAGGERPLVDEVAEAEARENVALESYGIDVGELVLHVVMAGPRDGMPVVLLHGFPEAWYAWHRQIAALARVGYRVAAPDLRGYGRSDKPASANQATGAHYARDIVGLLDGLSWPSAFLAGHDIGAGVAWRLIFEHPERIRKALLVNAAHPLAWEGARPEDDPEAISWFRSFFRLPFLPELVGRAGGYWLLAKNLRDTARPGVFNEIELRVYRSLWARDGTLSTMIDSYRAPFTPIEGIPSDGRVPVPVRIIWGERDAFLPLAGAELSERFVGKGNIVRVPEAGHWILAEEPDLVSDQMAEFFVADAPDNAGTGRR